MQVTSRHPAPVFMYRNNDSQAEQAISKYRGGRDDNPNPLNLPLRAGQDGLMYPFDAAHPEYLSTYQVGLLKRAFDRTHEELEFYETAAGILLVDQ